MNITSGKLLKAQKVIVYGPEGIGKSTFASQFPDPLFIDTEGSTNSLDVKRFDKPTSWTMLLEQVKFVKTNKPCKTLVIDTLDWAEILCKNHLIALNHVDSIEKIEGGWGKGYTMLAEEWGKFLNLLQEVIEVGIYVVGTAHSRVVHVDLPTEIGSYDRWELKLEKKTTSLTKEWADMVLFANYKTYVINIDNKGAVKGKNKAQGGERVMNTTHHPAYDAKNRHGLMEEIPFDFKQISGIFTLTNQDQVIEEAITSYEEIKDINEPTPVPVPMPPIETAEDYTGLPQALIDLMKMNNVTVQELMQAVFVKGHYPVNTPITNLSRDYIDGVLIAAWPQVLAMINEMKSVK